MEIIDSQTRQQMIEYIEKISQTSSTKIKNLLEKEKEFLDEGNKHEEKFSPRQFYMAVLRKKNLIKLEEFEGNIPKYLAIPEAESEVK